MLLVGLTGGIASGKSMAAEIFTELGVHLIDADKISREVVKPGTPGLKKIVDTFGSRFLQEDGSLDRPALADLIFGDSTKRQLLEGILHPLIAEKTSRQIDELAEKYPDGIVMVDAALMIEVGRHRMFDKLVVVWADEETQIQRLTERDGLDRAGALRRIEAQMPLTEKARFADYVIDNNASAEVCRKEVKRVYEELAKLAGS